MSKCGVLFTVTEGWSQELGPFNLKVDGASLDLTGLTIDVILRTGKGVFVSVSSGQIRMDPDQVAHKGDVYFTPTTNTFANSSSPYSMHWKLTDGASAVVFFPNGEADQVGVTKA